MDPIHCVGNSHVWLFNGEDDQHFPPTQQLLPQFQTYHLGPVIAYHFVEHHLPKVFQVLESRGTKPGAKVMLCVGEVDCRWHLPHQAQVQHRSVYEVTQECVRRFFKALLLMRERGYQMYAWGVHPSTDHGHMDPPGTDEVGPVFGQQTLRNSVAQFWNQELQTLCQQFNIPFISIYPYLVDEHNRTKMEYFRDYCHLSHKCLPWVLKEFGVL